MNRMVLRAEKSKEELTAMFVGAQHSRTLEGVFCVLDQCIMDGIAAADDPGLPDREVFLNIGETRGLQKFRTELEAWVITAARRGADGGSEQQVGA